MYHNWLPKAEKNTLKCLNSPEKRSDYDQPYPTIFGSVSHHAAHMVSTGHDIFLHCKHCKVCQSHICLVELRAPDKDILGYSCQFTKITM